MKKYLLAFLISFVTCIIGLSLYSNINNKFGDRVDIQRQISGMSFASSSAAVDTLSASLMCNYSSIKISPTHSAININLAASSTLYCLNRNGVGLDFYYINPSAVTSTTIIAGAGIDLATTSGAIFPMNSRAKISCYRRDIHTTDCLVIKGSN